MSGVKLEDFDLDAEGYKKVAIFLANLVGDPIKRSERLIGWLNEKKKLDESFTEQENNFAKHWIKYHPHQDDELFGGHVVVAIASVEETQQDGSKRVFSTVETAVLTEREKNINEDASSFILNLECECVDELDEAGVENTLKAREHSPPSAYVTARLFGTKPLTDCSEEKQNKEQESKEC
ncbi:MAG: hypothetical protein AAF490_22685 [Chloroflexota bacterium]